MMNNKFKLLIGALVLAAAGAGIGLYLWNKPHNDLSATPADFTLPASQLFEAFVKDETAANATYIHKVVEVSGTVQEVTAVAEGGMNVSLQENLVAAFVAADAAAAKALKPGQTITLRGNCDGATIMMGMGGVNLSRCVVVK